MKLLVDFLPILVFFIAYKIDGIYTATAVAIVITLLQIIWIYIQKKQIETIQWINLLIIVMFGGATLIFQNETFIKWKPTIFYLFMGMILLGGHLIAKKNFLQQLLSGQMQLETSIWNKLLYAWSVFFICMAILNLYIAYSFSTEFWVNFKLFGFLGCMLIFVLVQVLYLNRHIQHPEQNSQS